MPASAPASSAALGGLGASPVAGVRRAGGGWRRVATLRASTRPVRGQAVLGLKPEHGGARARAEAAVDRTGPIAAAHQPPLHLAHAARAVRAGVAAAAADAARRPAARELSRRRRGRAAATGRGSRVRASPPPRAGHCLAPNAAGAVIRASAAASAARGHLRYILHLQEIEREPTGADAGRGAWNRDAVQPGRSSREINGTGRGRAGSTIRREKKTASDARRRERAATTRDRTRPTPRPRRPRRRRPPSPPAPKPDATAATAASEAGRGPLTSYSATHDQRHSSDIETRPNQRGHALAHGGRERVRGARIAAHPQRGRPECARPWRRRRRRVRARTRRLDRHGGDDLRRRRATGDGRHRRTRRHDPDPDPARRRPAGSPSSAQSRPRRRAPQRPAELRPPRFSRPAGRLRRRCSRRA